MADTADQFWCWFVAHHKDVREAYESENAQKNSLR
jgi:hypothetical protein